MTRLRAEFDGDIDNRSPVTDYRTDENRFEVLCENCGKTYYVDESTREEWSRAAEHDHEKTFICPECEQIYEETAVA